MSKLESAFDFIIGAGIIDVADSLNDMSPYYLVKKDNIRLLVNIKDWVLEVKELNSNVNEKSLLMGKIYLLNATNLLAKYKIVKQY